MTTKTIGSLIILVILIIAITVTIISIKRRNQKFKDETASRNIENGDKDEFINTQSKAAFNSCIRHEQRKAKKMQKIINKNNKAKFNAVALEWKQKADLIKQELTEKCKFIHVENWSTLDGFINSISKKCPYCGSALERTNYKKLSYGGSMADVTYTRRENTGLYVGFNPIMQDVSYTQKALVGALYDNFQTRYIECKNCNRQIFTQERTIDKVEIHLSEVYSGDGEDKVRAVFRPETVHNRLNCGWRTPILEKELSKELKNYIDEPLILNQ